MDAFHTANSKTEPRLFEEGQRGLVNTLKNLPRLAGDKATATANDVLFDFGKLVTETIDDGTAIPDSLLNFPFAVLSGPTGLNELLRTVGTEIEDATVETDNNTRRFLHDVVKNVENVYKGATNELFTWTAPSTPWRDMFGGGNWQDKRVYPFQQGPDPV